MIASLHNHYRISSVVDHLGIMRQTTLHNYGFPTSSRLPYAPNDDTNHGKNMLMSLPPELRRKIYIYAGLFSGFDIQLNYEPPDEDEIDEEFCTQYLSRSDLQDIPQQREIKPWSEQVSHFIEGPVRYPKLLLDRSIRPPLPSDSERLGDFAFKQNQALPISLLYVTQEIAREVKKLFWAENHFSLASSDIGGLGIFNILPTIALSNFTALSIRLNHWDEEVIRADARRSLEPAPCHAACPSYGHEGPLCVPKNKSEKLTMSKWSDVCRRLAIYSKPKQLQLWVLCDVADVTSAKAWLSPLAKLPLLAACSIRLRGDKEDRDLTNFARCISVSLTEGKAKQTDSAVGLNHLPAGKYSRILHGIPHILLPVCI